MPDIHVHEHKHVKFEAASLIAARLCTACGSYVSAGHLSEHQDFHDQLVAANTQNASDQEVQVELF
jgi:hypothetical protein